MRVHGDLVEAGLERQSSAPTAFAGRIYINTTDDEVYVYKNGQWDYVISGQIPIDLASAPTDGYVLAYNSSSGKYEASAAGSGGETNTASNVGTAGVGVFKQKSGVDLEFKKINAGSSKVTITDDTGNDEVDIDIAEANIDHDALTNFVANEHIDHSSVSISAGNGLSGGGDLTTTRTLNIDINGQTADGSPDGATDYVLTYDASAGALKKVLLDNLPGGDVTGPGSSTDNALTRFDGTGGKTIQNSAATLDDSGNLSTSGSVASTNTTESTSATTGAIKSSGGISAEKNIVSGGQLSSIRNNAGNSGTSLTIDWNDANVQTITLTGNVTLTLNNPIDGAAYTLILVQDGTGSRTVTWPASVKWSGGSAPTLSTAASSIDIITLVYDGTSYYAASNLDFS